MPKQKKPSLILVFGELITDSLFEIFLAFVSGGYFVYRRLGGEKTMLEQIPVGVWWVALAVLIIRIAIKGVKIYRTELEKLNKPDDAKMQKKFIQEHHGTGDNYQAEQLTVNKYEQPAHQDENFNINPTITINDRWLSIVVPNPITQAIECYCQLTSIELNGNLDKEMKQYITEYTPRISLSGGNVHGKEEGVLVVDKDQEGKFNLVTPTHEGLGFEMARGIRLLTGDRRYGIGSYKINFDLRYKSIGDKKFQSKIFEVAFLCYENKSNAENQDISNDVIESYFGPQIFGGSDNYEHLYVKIVR